MKVLGRLKIRGNGLWKGLWEHRKILNSKAEADIQKNRLCLSACAAVLILIVIMLFIPPYLGVADDGSVTSVMRGAGLDFRQDDSSGEGADYRYFTRTYVYKKSVSSSITAQTLFIRAAQELDDLFTNDGLFDLRFLAAIYTAAFLPAFYLLVRSAVGRVIYFSEAAVIAAAAVFIFADAGCITYFSSFYPEALIYIGMLYCVGAAMNLQKESKFETVYLSVFTAAGCVLCFVKRMCFLAGIILALFCLFQIRRSGSRKWRGPVVLSYVILMAAAFGSFFLLEDDFSGEDKLHSMTRGVLLQADNPEKALEEFGIDPSFSILADASAYDVFPVTEGENQVLEEAFYSRYDSADIALYYIRHPSALAAMTDMAVKACVDMRRDYCGNYEKEAGMSEGARSIFWSGYSAYKNRSAPKTSGYLLVLVIAFTAMSFQKKKGHMSKSRRNSVYLQTMLMVTAIGLTEIWYVIWRSGDAAVIRYGAFMGIGLDLLLFYVAVEILDKLNILEKNKG